MKLLSAVVRRLQRIKWKDVEQKLAQILSLNSMQTASKQLSIYSMHGLYNQFKQEFIIYKCKEKFVILQSIGIIAIKSSETRSVIYTCKYSSGHF